MKATSTCTKVEVFRGALLRSRLSIGLDLCSGSTSKDLEIVSFLRKSEEGLKRVGLVLVAENARTPGATRCYMWQIPPADSAPGRRPIPHLHQFVWMRRNINTLVPGAFRVLTEIAHFLLSFD